jgi:hypothetical protein
MNGSDSLFDRYGIEINFGIDFLKLQKYCYGIFCRCSKDCMNEMRNIAWSCTLKNGVYFEIVELS